MAGRRPHGAQGCTVTIMAGYVFRRHHGRLPSVVEPRRGTVAIMAGCHLWLPGGHQRQV